MYLESEDWLLVGLCFFLIEGGFILGFILLLFLNETNKLCIQEEEEKKKVLKKKN